MGVLSGGVYLPPARLHGWGVSTYPLHIPIPLHIFNQPRRYLRPGMPTNWKGPRTRDTLSPCEQTHACENITFPQLRWRAAETWTRIIALFTDIHKKKLSFWNPQHLINLRKQLVAVQNIVVKLISLSSSDTKVPGVLEWPWVQMEPICRSNRTLCRMTFYRTVVMG